jgi:hypothetical protein
MAQLAVHCGTMLRHTHTHGVTHALLKDSTVTPPQAGLCPGHRCPKQPRGRGVFAGAEEEQRRGGKNKKKKTFKAS